MNLPFFWSFRYQTKVAMSLKTLFILHILSTFAKSFYFENFKQRMIVRKYDNTIKPCYKNVCSITQHPATIR